MSIYTAMALDIFGTHFCEGAINEGPLLTPTQTLDIGRAVGGQGLGAHRHHGWLRGRHRAGHVVTSSAQ